MEPCIDMGYDGSDCPVLDTGLTGKIDKPGRTATCSDLGRTKGSTFAMPLRSSLARRLPSQDDSQRLQLPVAINNPYAQGRRVRCPNSVSPFNS